MLIIPAVDIKEGNCVQLVGGETGTGEAYGDPVKAAIDWEDQGAPYLHVIDLDAAMGEGDNLTKIAEILANLDIGIEVGGGIRSVERGCELLGIGADRIILGTIAFKKPEVLKELTDLTDPSQIIIALDARNGEVVIEGWKEETGKDIVELAKEFEEMKIGGILFTNVDKEGRMSGIDKETIQKLSTNINLPIIAAGGVGSIQDVKDAKEAGAEALVIGTALYEGTVTLKEALEVAE
ncbi:MAG: 1-(5-phosphoribosyl)-5-[(5-phosphoribosylamino)methylideneamino]imidazole-4-carboxamide isomerase [Hadesarchaea archaeon]|nr:1-(5-phosphoribosyl)-5-[(5-phosphoribosylamino)methylideneamino]imidazole-4-carboxamide isomerase [Hadesarchaea archaeon]